MVPYVGGVERRRKPQPLICVVHTLASHRHTCLGSFFLDSEDIRGLSLGAIRNFSKGTGLPSANIRLWDTKDLFQGLGASEPQGLEPNYRINLNLNLSGRGHGCVCVL